MCKAPMSSARAGAGAPSNSARAVVVFGKAITSRRLPAPASNIATRSKPTAKPPCGGAPAASACSRKPEQPKYGALHLRIHDADRTRAQLVAVVDHVVMQRPARKRLAIELGEILGVRRREWVMREHRPPRVRIGLEQWEVHHPAERMRRGGARGGAGDDKLAAARATGGRRREPANDILAHAIEHRRRHVIGPHREQCDIAVTDSEATQ